MHATSSRFKIHGGHSGRHHIAILHTRSKTGRRALSRLLDAHLAQFKFSELFAKFSVIGGQRTYSDQLEEGGSCAIQWILVRIGIEMAENGLQDDFMEVKIRTNYLWTCSVSCLCFIFLYLVVFILFSAHSVWSHLPWTISTSIHVHVDTRWVGRPLSTASLPQSCLNLVNLCLGRKGYNKVHVLGGVSLFKCPVFVLDSYSVM